MKKVLFLLLLSSGYYAAFSQDCSLIQVHQAERYCAYRIHTELNDKTHEITNIQEIVFRNHSNSSLSNLRFYLYLNSFKNENSTFLKGANDIFGQSFKDRKPEEWANLDLRVLRIKHKNKNFDLSNDYKYICLDDNNKDDQSVMELVLPQAIPAGDTIIIHLEWEARMPKVIARAGYNQDFYLFCHWFPQLGVLEKNEEGNWGWNCHQFFRMTEFYGEFSDYDVWIKCHKDYRLCASGEFVDEILVGDKTVKHYRAEKVIDFTWAINKLSYITEWNWKNIKIRLMLPNDYIAQEKRCKFIIDYALQYMYDHVGYYPYSTLSVVCPPFHALRTGLMEYPTLITTGSLYGMPGFMRNSESLIVHEFVHQYFMAVLSNNEKEEPWMDEGFATYFEDRIVDAAYGNNKSLIDILGFRMDNKQLTRSEYTGMNDPAKGIIARPGWTFKDTDRKSLIYSKTATIFHSLERMIGTPNMDSLIKRYFRCYKFTHPRGKDFMLFLRTQLYELTDSSQARQCYNYVHFGIFEEGSMDYSVDSVLSTTDNETLFHYKIHLSRKGSWIHPVEIKLEYEDGVVENLKWSGEEQNYEITRDVYNSLRKVYIDPEQKILTDLNLNNNTYSVESIEDISGKYGFKIMFWWQSFTHFISLLI